jgi:GAF domain-containing protein
VDLALAALEGAVRAVGEALAADRCWLYGRDPETRCGTALTLWRRDATVTGLPPELRTWRPEAPDLPRTDPLFGRALAGEPLDLVDDTSTTDVDAVLERALGHRAFAHLNLHHGGELWGVLQPGMSDGPRAWTGPERDALLALRPALAPLVAAAVQSGWSSRSSHHSSP